MYLSSLFDHFHIVCLIFVPWVNRLWAPPASTLIDDFSHNFVFAIKLSVRPCGFHTVYSSTLARWFPRACLTPKRPGTRYILSGKKEPDSQLTSGHPPAPSHLLLFVNSTSFKLQSVLFSIHQLWVSTVLP